MNGHKAPGYILISSTILCIILFIFPNIDINFSKNFYTNTFTESALTITVFKSVSIITYLTFILYMALLLYKYFLYKQFNKALVYLIVTMITGPGLVINTIFKDHFGRARPKFIKEFGGSANFTKMMVISDQCQKNCSFSCGHAGVVYYFSSIAYIAPRKYFNLLFYFSIILGSIVGLVRIMQGGHFLSDVIFSILVVLVINHIMYYVIDSLYRSC